MENRKKSTAFKTIETVEELLTYLNTAERLDNVDYLYHYTNLKNVKRIIENKLWYLSCAKDMNDKYEYEKWNEKYWRNIYFACFTVELKENIGLWSMYGRPWGKGVKIAIPKTIFHEWIKSITQVEEVPENENQFGRKLTVNKDVYLQISSVAYSNWDNCEPTEERKITWSTASNTSLTKKDLQAPELVGYIKDMAWSYEREVRVKAKLKTSIKSKTIAIPISDEVIQSMIIMEGPLFSKESEKDLKSKIGSKVSKIDKSIFQGKISFSNNCKMCMQENGCIESCQNNCKLK